MRRARAAAAADVDVVLLAAAHEGDLPAAPPDFVSLPALGRTILDVAAFDPPRPLPLLGDILGSLREVDADLLVYTNVDIALMPGFYTAVARLARSGPTFVINRRTIDEADVPDPVDHVLLEARVGRPHPGRDCFVLSRALLDELVLGEVAVGADWVGKVMTWNLAAIDPSFRWFRDLHLTYHLGDDRTWADPRLAGYAEHNARVARVVSEELRRRHGHRPHWAQVAEMIAADLDPASGRRRSRRILAHLRRGATRIRGGT